MHWLAEPTNVGPSLSTCPRTMSLIAPRSERARWTRNHRARPDRGAISDIALLQISIGAMAAIVPMIPLVIRELVSEWSRYGTV